jgi:hypothetical protein
MLWVLKPEDVGDLTSEIGGLNQQKGVPIICMYIYIEREYVNIYVHIYMYIHIYIHGQFNV